MKIANCQNNYFLSRMTFSSILTCRSRLPQVGSFSRSLICHRKFALTPFSTQKLAEKPPTTVKEPPGPPPPKKPPTLIQDYLALSKARLSYFVTFTAHAGYCIVNDPSAFDYSQFFIGLTAGTFACSAAANTFNQITEQKWDSQMTRTMNRPLVRKNNPMTELHAKSFAAVNSVLGVSLLNYFCGLPCAVLGAANIILYAGPYTYLKRRHWLNTQIGAIVGAIPPLMGASCSPHGWSCLTDAGALSLAGILFFWQIPHFYAIAQIRKSDYTRAGYKMLPHSNEISAQRWTFYSALGLWPICLYSYLEGFTTHFFIGVSTLANLIYTYGSYKFYQNMKTAESQKLFKISLYYILMIVFGMFGDIVYKRYGYYQAQNCPVVHVKDKLIGSDRRTDEKSD